MCLFLSRTFLLESFCSLWYLLSLVCPVLCFICCLLHVMFGIVTIGLKRYNCWLIYLSLFCFVSAIRHILFTLPLGVIGNDCGTSSR